MRLVVAVCVLLAALVPSRSVAPTVVMILTDDQRFDTLDIMPMTRSWLGDAGVTFPNTFVASPLCCPSRASFLTGLYPSQHGILDNAAPEGGAAVFSGQDGNTLPVWLQSAGWKTAYIGKYLNEYTAILPDPPGWDDFRPLLDPIAYQNYTMRVGGVPTVYGTGTANYSTNVIFDHAQAVLSETAATDPLFLLIAPNAPHTNCKSNAADEAVAATRPLHRPPSFNEADVSEKPFYVRNTSPLDNGDIQTIDTTRMKCLATLRAVDRGVNALMQSLQASGRLDTALVLFTSDNGFLWGEHRLNNGKKCAYEECTKLPLLIRSPTTAGTVDDRLVSSLDWTATIADFAGVTPPYALEGLSLMPVLRGQSPPWRDAVFIEWFGNGRPKFVSVRESRFVYTDYTADKQGDELYDLQADPYQLQNLVNDPAFGVDVARLRTRLANR